MNYAEVKNFTVDCGGAFLGSDYGTAVYGTDYYGPNLVLSMSVGMNISIDFTLRILKSQNILYSELSKEVVE